MAQPDTQRHTLLEAYQEVSIGIRASEEWQPSYKAHPETFKALLKHEAALEVGVAEYLAALAERAPTYVDWSLVPEPVKAATNPLANKTDEVWKQEQIDFTKAIIEAIERLISTGGVASQLEYGIDLGVTPLTDWVLKAAREHTAALVTQVIDTERKIIQEAIRKNISQGGTLDDAANLIRKAVNDPARAALIAQTESVNAYQSGVMNFGLESGAKRKVWESLAGACKICAPLDGKPIAITKQFSLSSGKEVDHPPSHPRCRCGSYLEY